MPSNFTGLNVSKQQGEGAANIITWQNTDRAIEQLRQDQKQREAMGYKDYLAMQTQLQKEFANVRSADIPDLMKSYNDYKRIRQGMLFNHKLRNNPEEYARAEQAANEALSKTYNLIGMSKEQKDFHHSLSQDLLQHRDDYADDSQQRLSVDLTKPTPVLVQEGKNTVNPYLYNGSNTDFGKFLKDSQGEANQLTAAPTQLTKDGLQFIDTAYKHGNNPAQVASALTANFAKHAVGKDAAWSYRNLPDEDKIKVQQAYDNLGQDYWDKWGVKKETQNLQQGNGVSDAQKYAIYLAQKGALQNEPQLGEPKYRDNAEAKMNLEKDLQLRNQKVMEGIRQGNRKALVDYREHYKKLNKAQQGEFLDSYLNSLYDDAKKNPKEYVTPDGRKSTQYDMKASPDVRELFAFKNGTGKIVYPDRIRLLENGDVQPIFFKYDANGKKAIRKDGKGVVDEEWSVPMLKNEFRARIGKQLLGQKEANSQLGDGDDESGYEYDQEIRVPVPASSVPGFLRK